MSADRLRQAAQKIRDTARGFVECVGVGPLTVVLTGDGYGLDVPGVAVADGMHEEVADHIALWSPPVALAVADWLDYAAEVQARRDKVAVNPYSEALAVADLILGESA